MVSMGEPTNFMESLGVLEFQREQLRDKIEKVRKQGDQTKEEKIKNDLFVVEKKIKNLMLQGRNEIKKHQRGH